LDFRYVGEGARMVRELFEMARTKKACLIFFDEIDAVGGARWVLEPVFRIHDILVWIRIRRSMPLTNGYGSGSWIRILPFSSLTFKMPAKN
jgi:hypothetical protein